MAAGAISYYLDRFVVGRIVRYTYGTPASIRYDPADPEHRKRAHQKYMGISGRIQIDVFSPTLFKVTDFRTLAVPSLKGLNRCSGHTGVGNTGIPG